MVITHNEQQKTQLTGWAYLYRNTVQGNKLGYSQLKKLHIWVSWGGGLREASWRRSPHLPARLVSLTHFQLALKTKMAQICFSFKNIKTVLGERQTAYVPLLYMNDSAGTTWNRDGPLLPPHPEGREVEDAVLEGWGGLWCSVSLCQTVWGNERWKDIELWMIFISQFTDEKE